MIVIDANLLVYAYDAGVAQHKKAREWVEETFSSAEMIKLPSQAVYAFLRFHDEPEIARGDLLAGISGYR